MRLFIALNLPENVKNALDGEAEALFSENLFSGKLTPKSDMHLTLKFLGEVSEDKVGEIVKKLKEIKFEKFEAMLGNFGVFDEQFVKIIWAKVLNCENLQREVDLALRGVFPMEDRFMGHVTLARVKSVKEKRSLIDRIKKMSLGNIKFKVESFELMRSELGKNPQYSVVERFELL